MLPPRSFFLPFLTLLLALFPALTAAQTYYGSFYTAIYVGGNPSYSGGNLVSCSDKGFSNYCCSDGQYCALDGTGAIACCPSGNQCQGQAVYTQHVTSTVYAQVTTTIRGVVYVTVVQATTTQAAGAVGVVYGNCPTTTLTMVGDGIPTTRGCTAIVSPSAGKKQFDFDTSILKIFAWMLLMICGGMLLV
ncbi:MAG: hypothetical protein M1834_002909 [Cirrosporium novae-zelandiae]|nr:MAG: hypothetical protein M1834_002909 [Cirrosporium novae-zelandiae]